MTTPVDSSVRSVPGDVEALVQLMLADSGRPRLTWYGPGGERIELSGAVLVNWTTKIANLLDEEVDAGAGTRVLIDLPPHWQSILWSIGTWRRGACVVLGGPEAQEGVDVVVTDRPEAYGTAAELVAVTLAPLARTFVGDLPAGAIDAAAAVMTYADVMTRPARYDGRALAATAAGADVSYGALLEDVPSRPPRARHLAVAGPGRLGLRDLHEMLASLAVDGSHVLMHPGHAATIADPAAMAGLVSSERITSPPEPGEARRDVPTV